MIRLAIFAMLASSSGTNIASARECPRQGVAVMFIESTMDYLGFLEGRWSGTAPDGSVFYEEYDRPDALTLRSRRFEDQSFITVSDGSIVAFKDGQITSTWGEYVWCASEIIEGRAAFEPINAPSSFAWQRVDADNIEVTQKWTDENGAPQTYSLTLNRIR